MAYQLASNHHGPFRNWIRLNKNYFIAFFSEVIKVMLPKYYFKDKRKIEINTIGAETGNHLSELLSGEEPDLLSLSTAILDLYDDPIAPLDFTKLDSLIPATSYLFLEKKIIKCQDFLYRH